MSKKHTIEEVREFIEGLGYELISEEYVNAHSKMVLKDNYGYLYECNYTNLNTGQKPDRFNKSNSYTIQNIKLWCVLNNKSFELISEKYDGNNKKLKWKCFNCDEIFLSTWGDITNNRGCAVCAGMQVTFNTCLATLNSELASEWHPSLNKNLTAYDVTCNSAKKVWWLCKFGHEWKSTIASRNNGIGCPCCSKKRASKDYNLLICEPKLASEWNYEKNKRKPEDYCPTSGQKVWWKCNKCGNEWEDTINHRKDGRNCGCEKSRRLTMSNCLCTLRPDLASEWDYDKNKELTPFDVNQFSNREVWWICKKNHKHKWKSKISNRTSSNNTGCPKCSQSKGEKRIRNFFDLKNVNCISQKKFKGLIGLGGGNLSYDFYLPQYNLLIEYQGEQHEKYLKGFHASKEDFEKQLEHDRRKREYCVDNNIELLEIWYWDYDNIEEILNKHLNKK